MAILQVKNMDDHLYAALKRLAVRDDRTISLEVVVIIKNSLAQKRSRSGAAQTLLQLAGSWEDTRSAAGIIADIRKSRRNSRRCPALG